MILIFDGHSVMLINLLFNLPVVKTAEDSSYDGLGVRGCVESHLSALGISADDDDQSACCGCRVFSTSVPLAITGCGSWNF